MSHAEKTALKHLALVPFDNSQWQPMLHSMAEATDGWLGQLVARKSDSMHLNCWSDPSFSGPAAQWLALGGLDARLNPYVEAGVRLRAGHDLADWQIVDSKTRSRHPLLNEFYARQDIPHLCFAKLYANEKVDVMLTCLASEKQGPMNARARQTFRKLSTSTAKTLRTAVMIKSDAGKLLAGAFGAVSIDVFVCDYFGRVIAMSESAEDLIRDGSALKLRGSYLHAATHVQTKALEEAIRSAARHTFDDPHAAVTDADISTKKRALSAKVIALPCDRCDIGLGASVLVIVESTSASNSFQRSGLTPAEVRVATQLLAGSRLHDIALLQNVSKETIRSQAKSAYAKLGVSGQIELIARYRENLTASSSRLGVASYASC